MHLKSLTLRGFKSFAQPTTFQFEPGVTAIVGPNGSGKSNVVDALAWVMGEQGAKNLRGGKMEDVIFAGTSTRGPLGRAEVRLTIDNSDGALPIEYSEVTISRTLFRSGASEYAINGEGCRLLDVQELLSDSGLGREMHVIVGQGQLDAVLRATPEERRGFIEEAAGILKHRRRKERTLRKLDGMEANLTRLNDLAGELRRQLKPLGRQAEVARAAQGIAAEVRDAKARLIADDVTRLKRELEDLSRNEAERHQEQVVLQEQSEQKRLRITHLETEQQGDALDEARRVTMSLETAQSKLRGLYTQAQQRLTFLATQADPDTPAHRITKSTVSDAETEATELDQLIPQAEEVWEQARLQTRTAQAALDAIDEQVAAQSAAVSAYDLRVSQLRGSVSAAEQKRDAVTAEIERRKTALTQADERVMAAERELTEFEERAAEAGAGDLADDTGSGADRDAIYRAAQDAQVAAEQARDEARDRLHELEREGSGLDARISALARSLEAKDASAAILAEAPSGVLGRVADHFRVQEGASAAIGVALGSLADALLAEDEDSAVAAIRQAHDGELGRLRAVVAGASSAAIGAEAPEIAGLTHASEVILEAPAGVRALLQTTYIATDLAAAQAGAVALRALPGAPDFTVVTELGDVITAHTLAGGSGQAPSRIELTGELDQARARRAEVSELLAGVEIELGELRALVTKTQADAKRIFEEMREADARVAAFQNDRNRLVARAEAGRAEAERAKTAYEGVAGNGEAAQAEAERAAELLAEALADPRPVLDVTQREGAQRALDEHRQVELDKRLALETARERARAAHAQAQSVERQFEAERIAAEEAARRAVLRARQTAQAERVAARIPMILEACDRSLIEARVAQQSAEQVRARNTQELTLLRAEEADLRARLQDVTNLVHGSEMKSHERRIQFTSLVERAANELGLREEVLLAEYGPSVLIPIASDADGESADDTAGADREAPRELSLEEQLAAELGEAPDAGVDEGSLEAALADELAGTTGPAARVTSAEAAPAAEVSGIPYIRAEQEARLARAEQRLAALGRINPLALEEFAALEQRHKFLVEQLEDLTRTRADLRGIITELDDKMKDIFAAAFADTKAAFSEVFPILFPGGAGEVVLTNPDDMLTTGIEISVRPAGKKVERLSLLSGGERSLAAVAWLIAIFQARPSPFYIMDEVEAALDDANLGRLLEVFERLRENSQLIVITHQKRTMEIADALYGVSMRKDGISAVVGQRLARDGEVAETSAE